MLQIPNPCLHDPSGLGGTMQPTLAYSRRVTPHAVIIYTGINEFGGSDIYLYRMTLEKAIGPLKSKNLDKQDTTQKCDSSAH